MITKKIKKFKHFWQENFQKNSNEKKKDINLDRNEHYSIYL